MRAADWDVIVIGAGVAGLAAFHELNKAGLRTCCLEARDRIGGRILTVHDPLTWVPIDLGPEFLHGLDAGLWDLIRGAGLKVSEAGGHTVDVGPEHQEQDADRGIDRVMADVQRQVNQDDESFQAFLDRSRYSEQEKRVSASFVEGFNAARKEIISVASLAKDARASDRIQGDRAFRIVNGYDAVARALLNGVPGLATRLRLNAIVETVEWASGQAAIGIRSALDGRREVLRCSRVIVTIPLGLLQAPPDGEGAIRFDPEPGEILEAARSLRFGQAIRITLCFEHAFWEGSHELRGGGFLSSDEPLFPTWWTPQPWPTPVITGWSAGPKADALLGQAQPVITTQALESLARILGVQPSLLQSAHLQRAWFHDWHGDKFARGAYSYVPAGAMAARETLARPVGNVLFFAGEATDVNGHAATVHGAIASGRRAARQVIDFPVQPNA